ncbi:MAG: hypothetical protein KGZ83_14605 [Sulfuricella sp.]|nr:hypothetical protein [Sulfuricella sp.]
MQFIGREDWLARFEERRNAPQGGIWHIVGQPGIGKTTLLGKFAQLCDEKGHPHTLLDVADYAPANGLEILTELARSARHFDAESGGKRLGEWVSEKALQYKDGIGGVVEQGGKLIDPTGGLLAGGIKSLLDFGLGLAGNAAQASEQAAAARPELFLVEALAAAGKKKPVLLIDTWEHLLRADAKLQSRLTFSLGVPREGIPKSLGILPWLHALLTYLQDKGWRIIQAGREIPQTASEDRLPRFTRAEILEAARARYRIAACLPEQQDDIAAILATLSFEGNPLWLQVALNLLENLLAEGKDLARLARDPDALQHCFEEDDASDLGQLYGYEQGRCKLALLGTITRHIEGIEDHAWKIALPRILDKGLVAQLFAPEQARAVRHNFQIAGVFRKSGDQFTLHEEIRDLLLAYARSKGWLDSEETRGLHGRLWDYLNQTIIDRLQAESGKTFSLEGASDPEIEKALQTAPDTHLPVTWIAEAAYHRVLSYSELADKTTSPADFWSALGGSSSLSWLEKWRIAKSLPDLSEFQVREIMRIFLEERSEFSKLLGEQTAFALRQNQLAGDHASLGNIEFWEKRVREHGLPGDYFGFQQVLSEQFSEVYPARIIELADALLSRFATSNDPGVQVQCANALVNKGRTLGDHLADPQGEVAAYDDLLARYGESENPEVQVLCAKALVNKGVTLGERLDNPQGEVAVYDHLLARYGESDNPEVQVLCAKALVYKGVTLGNRLADPQGEVAAYDDLLARYGESDNPEVQLQCIKALFNKGVTLVERLADPQGALAAYDDLLARYGESDNPAVRVQCAKALVSKGWALGERLADPQGEVAAYDDLLARYGESDNPEVQALCAKALAYKGGTLGERLADPQGALAAYDDLLACYGESDNPEVQAQCLSGLSNSAELLLVLGNADESVRRAEQALSRLEQNNPKAAIMVFLRWLGRGDAAPDEVLAAIHALPGEVKFNWGWDEIRLVVARLEAPRQCLGGCFIAYFEQHRDVGQLAACLAACAASPG